MKQAVPYLYCNDAGATICKCLNRAAATVIAGALGFGVHWIANQFGGKVELIILQASVFLLGNIFIHKCFYNHTEMLP